uniref:Transmembrane protein 182 n=1 Tax=Sus scrofa TaxID=9823 RepID=A0A8D1ELI1_PIG
MRLNIAIFFGALFGALGVLLFLVSFGSDYWLLVTEVGKCSGEQNIENVTFHHEGFFWRCWFNGIVEENDSNIWQFWYTNQPPSKNCTHAYLSPYPFMRGEHNTTSYDSAVIYRGFWAVLMLLGVVAVVTASFLIICAAPFASHFLYKVGGGSYIAAGPHLQYTEVPIATQDPSLVCNLHHSSWQCRILNPLSQARDRTHNLMVPSRIH